jgi:hypothetical protein
VTPLPPALTSLLCEAADAPEGIDSVEALATLWLADNRAADGEENGDALPWSHLCVYELHEHPEALWAFIRAALAGARTGWQAVMLAAGPLEDLIAGHGPAYIDRIEDQAARSARFRFALTGVWPQGQEDGPVWPRILAARAPAMATGIDAGGPLPD